MVGLETLRVVAGCLGPFMPGVAHSLQEALGAGEGKDGEVDRSEAMHHFWSRWDGKVVKTFPLF